MASYRYERDIDPKDIAPRKERQYTRKERWANWWDYNLKWVIIIGIAAAFVAYNFIGQYFFVTKPDYNVAVVAPYYLPEDTVNALQDALAALRRAPARCGISTALCPPPTATRTGGTWCTSGTTARSWLASTSVTTAPTPPRAGVVPVRSICPSSMWECGARGTAALRITSPEAKNSGRS